MALSQVGAVPAETVSWSASAPAGGKVKPGAKLQLTLRGDVQKGWHVYALRQLPTGPTPLKVGVEASDVAAAEGAVAGSPAVRKRDPSFDLDTEYYERPFTVTVPVRIGAKAPAGKRAIPVNVRYQTCNGTICQPPKTVRVNVPVDVQGGA